MREKTSQNIHAKSWNLNEWLSHSRVLELWGGSVKTPAHGSVGHKHANEIGIIGKKNNIKPESIYYAPI